VNYNLPKGYSAQSSIQQFGTVGSEQAILSAKCQGKEVGVSRWKGMNQDARKMEDVITEFINMPYSCVNKKPHVEPCVPHSTVHVGPMNDLARSSYFTCRFEGPGSSVSIPTPAPFVEWVYVNDWDGIGGATGRRGGAIRVDYVVRANCTMPTIEQLQQTAGYDFKAGEISLTVHMDHMVNGSIPTEIPYMGPEGGNVLRLTELLTPPMAPTPPASPPAPWLPWGENGDNSPGMFYRRYAQQIDSFDFGSYSRLSNLCWSSRVDTESSNVWHSKCNGKGYTVLIGTALYNGVQYIAGAYTRISWAGGGYATDAAGHIFQIRPNMFKTLAGSGPHGSTSHAIYRSNNYGPTFGAGHDWHISANMKTGYNNFGHSYKCRTGNYGQNTCKYDLLGHYSSWSLSELEMWSTN